MDPTEPWRNQTEALGAFIRAQRRLADLSLREMATMTHVSNAYLSQIERGLHQPSVRVLGAIARALDVPPDELLAQAGLGHAHDRTPPTTRSPAEDDQRSVLEDEVDGGHVCSTERAILADPLLSTAERQALLGVYRSFTASGH